MGERKIELTREQFLTLLKLVYLGNWMANAHRTGSAEDPQKKDYEDIEHLIFSYAKKFGFDRYVDDEDGIEGRFYPTSYFEEETDVDDLHQEYDEETFWDELANRLGERDLFRHYTEEEIQKMSREERMSKLYEFIDKWSDEINEHGIERLSVNEERNDH